MYESDISINHEIIESKKADKQFVKDSFSEFLSEIGSIPMLTYEREQELGKIIKDGGEDAVKARNELIQSNLRLVVYYAKKYTGSGVDIEDLVSMGQFGLIRAAEKFDFNKECRFSTYATFWIKQTISRGIAEQGGLIRLPIGKTNLRVEYNTVSLEAKVGECEKTLEEYIANDNNEDLCEIAIKSEMKEKINELLNMLKPKEKSVLKNRYGIGIETPMTLEEVSSLPEFQVSRERIRQIEQRTLGKIRKNNRFRKIISGYETERHKEECENLF